MNIKEQLIKEIDQIPEPLLSQLLDFALFIKNQYFEDEVSSKEKAAIDKSRAAYEAGDYQTIEQFEQSLSSGSKTTQRRKKSQVKAFQDLFENLEPVSADFDEDEVKWEALKEKYDL